MPRSQKLDKNVAAFLDMIAVSELGEKLLKASDDGYNVIVGSTPAAPILFNDYSDHPKQLIDLPKIGVKSTAAGRYQLLARYFDAYKRNFPRFVHDFSPLAQDWIACQMLREQGAINLIVAGKFDEAIKKVSNIWASLPGAGYGQHENDLAKLRTAYTNAGGVLA